MNKAIAPPVADARATLNAARANAQAVLDAIDEALDALDDAPPNGVQSKPLPHDLIELKDAAERFGVRENTLRKWCRKKEGIGVLHGSRWQVSIAALRRHVRKV